MHVCPICGISLMRQYGKLAHLRKHQNPADNSHNSYRNEIMTTPAYDPNDVLFGSAVPSAKFEALGDNYQGTIVKLDASQQRKYDPKNPGGGEPKTWPDGRPMMQVIVTVQTDLRDPQVPDDDGQRRIFIKGKNLTDGTKDAVKKAGAKRMNAGDWISVTFTREEPSDFGGNPAKIYEVEYRKGDGGANSALGLTEEVPATPVPAQAGKPAAATTGAAALDLGGIDPAVAAKIQAMLAAQAQA